MGKIDDRRVRKRQMLVRKRRNKGFETAKERGENRWTVLLGENKIARGE